MALRMGNKICGKADCIFSCYVHDELLVNKSSRALISNRMISRHSKPWTQRLHVYSELNNWESVVKFSESLLQNVLFNEDGLVMINKPYGIGTHVPPNACTPSPALNTATVGQNSFYLSEALPYLSDSLGYPNLTVIRAPERYTSGVTILSANDKVSSRIRQCIQKSNGQQYLFNTYWIVAVGCPQPSQGSFKLGLKLEPEPIGKGKQPILVKSWSKAAVQRQEIHPTLVTHTILQKGPLASLLEVQSYRTRAHFLRVYLAYLLSPVLGDHLYGSRVQNVLGVPMSISPFSDRAKLPQNLRKELRIALNIQVGQEVIVPAHIHLKQVTLLNYKGKGNSLQVAAPLPASFVWSCKQLYLQTPPTLQLEAVM